MGVRKSMRKFEVVHSMLDVEVCSVAKVMPCAINRQVMMALLSLGLDEQVRQPITVMVWSCTTGNVGKREEALESTVSAIQMAQHIHHASALQHLQEHACSISISGLIRTPVNTRTPAYGADAMQLCGRTYRGLLLCYSNMSCASFVGGYFTWALLSNLYCAQMCMGMKSIRLFSPCRADIHISP